MTRLRERMKEWLSEKKGKLRNTLPQYVDSGAPFPLPQHLPPAIDPLAALPRELRDHVFDFLVRGMYIRRSQHAFDRLGRLYTRRSPHAVSFGGKNAGMLATSRQYREEFTRRIRAAGIDHHHVHILIDLTKDAVMPDFDLTENARDLVASGASGLTIWVTLRCQDTIIKWSDPGELESARFYDMIVKYIESYRTFNDPIHTQQIAIFIMFEDLPSTGLGSGSTFRSKLYWKMATWRMVRELRPHVEEMVRWYRGNCGNDYRSLRWFLSRGDRDEYTKGLATSWDNDVAVSESNGIKILPPYFGGITVFANDPTSRSRLVHFWFRPEQMLVAAQIQQAHQNRREQIRQVKALKKRLAAMRREEALLKIKIWWYQLRLLGDREQD